MAGGKERTAHNDTMSSTTQLPPAPEASIQTSLTPDEVESLTILRENAVDSTKLRKLVNASVGQADTLIREYNKTKSMPAAMAKAFLGAIFSALVTHTNEAKQRGVQIEPLQILVDDPKLDRAYKESEYSLGENALKPRLALVQKLKSNADSNLREVDGILHSLGPAILEEVGPEIKKTSAEYAAAFERLDKAVMSKVEKVIRGLLSGAPNKGAKKQGQPPSNEYPHLKDPKDPMFLIALLADARKEKMKLDDLARRLVEGVEGARPKFAPLKSIERALVKVYEKYACLFDQVRRTLGFFYPRRLNLASLCFETATPPHPLSCTFPVHPAH